MNNPKATEKQVLLSPDEQMLKDEIIELLAFPLLKMENHLQLEECPHAGYYDHGDDRCIDCFQGDECLWVQQSEHASSCQKKNLQALLNQLQIAIDFIDLKLVAAHRSKRRCYCDNCSWLTRANALMDKVTQKVMIGP